MRYAWLFNFPDILIAKTESLRKLIFVNVLQMSVIIEAFIDFDIQCFTREQILLENPIEFRLYMQIIENENTYSFDV